MRANAPSLLKSDKSFALAKPARNTARRTKFAWDKSILLRFRLYAEQPHRADWRHPDLSHNELLMPTYMQQRHKS